MICIIDVSDLMDGYLNVFEYLLIGVFDQTESAPAHFSRLGLEENIPRVLFRLKK